MAQKYPLMMAVIGVGLMAVGISDIASAEMGMMLFILGFVTTVSGLVLSVKATRGMKNKKKKEEKDSPAIIRGTGVAIGLASLTAPYFGSPTASGATNAAYSVIDILIAAVQGVAFQIDFMVLVLVSVVLAGSFIAVFHHVGGYIILLGGMTAVFMSMGSVGSGAPEAVLNEIGYGLYLMLFAAFIIISSALSDTTDVYDSESDWASTLIVR